MATLSFRLPAVRLNDRSPRCIQRLQAGLAQPRRPGWQAAVTAISEAVELAPAALPIELPGLLASAGPATEPPDATGRASVGWFESTWELQQGLEVAEGLPSDLPLEVWLQACLQS